MKDALGHGSNAHGSGVEQVGKRYHVKLQPYSLADGKVGRPLGRDVTVSTHRSLSAAGDKLGSMISGKLASVAHEAIASARQATGEPAAARYIVEDRETGKTYSRDDAKRGKTRDEQRLDSAYSAMHRLRETFHAGGGNNRHGEYGRNTIEAFNRHGDVVHSLTGVRHNIYDKGAPLK